MPEPSFLDTSKVDVDGLIYSQAVMDAVRTNLFTPIQRVNDCIANGVPVKRGVLLGGTYGTGKTLAATCASRLAEDNGITYVYCPRASELADAIEFAKQYQSPACVVFCEDIDRAVNGERTVAMDDILNIIDGIDSKKANIITVLTTNDLDGINPAMLRPGRLDAVIEVTPPDAKATERLIRYYGGESISANEDLTEAARVLSEQGAIPAIIAEVVHRAKLAQITIQQPGTKVTGITGEALKVSAETMAMQLALLARAAEKRDEVWTMEELIHRAVSAVRDEKSYVAPPKKTNGHSVTAKQ
jgi:transitional endoplasmic reticulum ATPase